ncbi:metal ABC transporter ATP-binding protein [Nesterenkonia sp. PF2B19]|uniref:metal ABC transporter ATP-binding protein n=1 Tax=Nesterenkonia sp. PF2B19 TaxID=1881858 RepID=UPI0008731AA3|nr:metal ABC transporter ATP-binding protein [Nesterenkonia sp. PF2B19]OSM44405.1 ABC transporter [Nesterenkonia sp. PF2B19]
MIPTETTTAISVEGLSAGYPGVLALQEVNLTVRSGRICALVGANGSGKSTLFAALLGLRSPAQGRVRLFGRSPHAARRRNLVSYVPQHDQVDPSFPVTVEQTVMMGRYGHLGFTRRPRAADREHVESALEQVGLAGLRSRTIGELSGGQRRRTFLARSIAQRAPLMLLDEPFAGVDRVSEELIVQVLHQLRDAGTTLLVSTHHLEGIPDLAEEVVLLHRTVLAAGPPGEVLTEERMADAFGAVLGLGAASAERRQP